MAWVRRLRARTCGRAPVVARIRVYSEANGSSRWLLLSCATESVFKTVVVQSSSIVEDTFVHKPVARRTQGDQVQLRIVTGVAIRTLNEVEGIATMNCYSGDDSELNLITLCASCHRLVHERIRNDAGTRHDHGFDHRLCGTKKKKPTA